MSDWETVSWDKENFILENTWKFANSLALKKKKDFKDSKNRQKWCDKEMLQSFVFFVQWIIISFCRIFCGFFFNYLESWSFWTEYKCILYIMSI